MTLSVLHSQPQSDPITYYKIAFLTLDRKLETCLQLELRIGY
jgi:hypothetical protein